MKITVVYKLGSQQHTTLSWLLGKVPWFSPAGNSIPCNHPSTTLIPTVGWRGKSEKVKSMD